MTSEEARKIREKFGMSRTAFSREVLNVPYSTVEKWERGDYAIGAAGAALYRAVDFIRQAGLIEEFKKN